MKPIPAIHLETTAPSRHAAAACGTLRGCEQPVPEGKTHPPRKQAPGLQLGLHPVKGLSRQHHPKASPFQQPQPGLRGSASGGRTPLWHWGAAAATVRTDTSPRVPLSALLFPASGRKEVSRNIQAVQPADPRRAGAAAAVPRRGLPSLPHTGSPRPRGAARLGPRRCSPVNESG